MDFICGKVNFLPYQNLSPDAEGEASIHPCNLASGWMRETDLLSFLPCSFLRGLMFVAHLPASFAEQARYT